MPKRIIHYAWIVLIGLIIIRGFAGGGINMTSGLFLSPVSKELGIGIGSLSIYLSITSIVMILWLPTAGKIVNRYDIKWVALISGALQCLSFIGFGMMKNVYGWYILAIPYSLGATILVNLMGPILINRWFAKNTGTMIGIQMAFVGIFAAILQPTTSKIIANNGWRSGYYIIGGITLIAVIICSIFMLKSSPKEINMVPFGEGTIDDKNKIRTKEDNSVNISNKEATSSLSFYLLLLFMVSITGVGVFTQHIPTYGVELGYSIDTIGLALSFSSIGTAIGSIAIGIICDRVGGLKTCISIIVLGVISIIGFYISSYQFAIFCASTFMHGFVSSGIAVLAPILTISFFGQKDYEKIYAKVAMGAPLASIVLIPIYGFIYDKFSNYLFVLHSLVVLLIIALLCIIFGWNQRKKLIN